LRTATKALSPRTDRYSLHDLPHTGNHITAKSGATLRDMMDRMGHSTTRAALMSWAGISERVTRIELALSAWETDRSTLVRTLIRQLGRPSVAVVVPS
jgi:hypothetical protein